MRLIRLTSNKDSFRTITFNSSGLSLIIGKQKNPEKTDATKTYNGVGKSLSIYLVHFCLGAKSNDSLAARIPNWEFILSFSVGEDTYQATRNTLDQEKILLNGESLSLKRFQERLLDLTFQVPQPTPFLKFRPLVKRFIRPDKESYVHFDAVRMQETDYEKQLYKTFLLGLDLDLSTAKRNIKQSLDQVRAVIGHQNP